jgi:hypothetical protein
LVGYWWLTPYGRDALGYELLVPDPDWHQAALCYWAPWRRFPPKRPRSHRQARTNGRSERWARTCSGALKREQILENRWYSTGKHTVILKSRILRKIINETASKSQEKIARHRKDIKATRTRTSPGKTERQRVIERKRKTLRAKPGFARPCAIALWHACVWPECFGSTVAESKEERGASRICRAEGVLRNAERDEAYVRHSREQVRSTR